MNEACLPCVAVCGAGTLLPSCIKSLTNVSLIISVMILNHKSEIDKAVENGKVRRMEDKLLSPRPSWSANTVTVRNVVRSVRTSCVSVIV